MIAAQAGVPGTVIAADKHELVVAAGEGAVSLLRCSRPGGK